MPRSFTRTITLYTYSELSDSAKERAASWYREACASDDAWYDSDFSDFLTIAAACGWEVATNTRKTKSGHTFTTPCIFFSGFSSQGDGACFEGSWSASRVSVAALVEHAPTDETLHSIVREFARLATTEPHAWARSTHHGSYCHERSVSIDASPNDGTGDESADLDGSAWLQWERDFEEATASLSHWLYRDLESSHAFAFYNEEGISETMEANGWTFDATGNRAD